MIRTIPFSTQARKIPIETEKKIARDFYTRQLTTKELAEKYGKSRQHITNLLSLWKPEKKDYPKTNKEQVILVNEEQMEFLTFLLHEWQIDFRVPENYEYQETFESKINQ